MISLSLSFSQDKIDGSNLKEINGKYYSNNNLFTGKAYFFYPTEQPKEIVEFKNGDKKGSITTYYQDKNYKKSNYRDTNNVGDIELKKYIQKKLLDGIIKDTLNTFLKRKNYFNDEIGGDEKWIKLKDKWDKNELKGKKYELVQEYINLGSYHSAAVRYYLKEKSTLDQLDRELQNEKNKPVYSSKVFEDYSINSDKKDGFYTSFYQNGNKKTEGLFKNGAKDELWVEYFENGKIESQIKYTNDIKNGEWKKYDVNGDLLLIDNYTFNIKDGLHKEFAGNTVVEEGIFTNGLMIGEWVFRFKDEKGNLKGKGSFNNGNGTDLGTTGIPKNGREGIWKFYHPNGKLESESNYLNGKLQGLYKSYFENGVLEREVNYLNGQWEGLCKFYYENEVLKSEENRKQNERNGICKFYHPNGKLHIAGDYLYGKLEGLCKTYYENGVLKSEENLKQDERNGICKFYHPNGKLKREGNYLNGKLEGLCKDYYENGVLKLESSWKRDEFNGLVKSYFTNGKIQIIANFVNGKLNGDAKEYNENGELIGESAYKDGKANNYLSDYIEKTGNAYISEMKDQFLNGRTFTQKEYDEHYLCRYCRTVTINGWKNGYKADKKGYNSITDGYLLQAYSPKGLREMFPYCRPMCAKEDNE